jgi:hypothetical protein
VIISNKLDLTIDDLSASTSHASDSESDSIVIKPVIVDTACLENSCLNNHVVSIFALFCVWTKSLMCNDVANKDSTFQSEVRRISKFPVSHPDDVSSRPDAHLSTAPSDGRRVIPSRR